MIKEKEMLEDLLLATKLLLSMYTSYGWEGSNMPLRNLLQKQQQEVTKQNFDIFSIMLAEGLYPVMPAEAKEIKKAVDKHTQMQQQLDKLS